MTLSPEAGRVLGCLVEKQLTTPQQYPLTLNALTAAANQATNRDPVVDLGEDMVEAAVDELRAERLVRVVLPSHGRSVKRYRHVLDEVYGLDAARSGLLAVLLLRGPQTVGELRARTERMVDLASVDAVADELTVLAEHPDDLVRSVARAPGQKEDRWQQVVAAPWGGTGDAPAAGVRDDGEAPPPVEWLATDPEPEHGMEAVRREVADLRLEVAALRSELDDLRGSLGG